MPTAQPQASVVTGGGDGRKLSGNLDDLQCTTAFVQRAGVSIRVVDNNKQQNKKRPAAHVSLRAECRSFHRSGGQQEGLNHTVTPN